MNLSQSLHNLCSVSPALALAHYLNLGGYAFDQSSYAVDNIKFEAQRILGPPFSGEAGLFSPNTFPSLVGRQDQNNPATVVPSYPDVNLKVCGNCGTSNTPLWRKEGRVNMCNACGIYYKIHGFHRPVELILAAQNTQRRSSHDSKAQFSETSKKEHVAQNLYCNPTARTNEHLIINDKDMTLTANQANPFAFLYSNLNQGCDKEHELKSVSAYPSVPQTSAEQKLEKEHDIYKHKQRKTPKSSKIQRYDTDLTIDDDLRTIALALLSIRNKSSSQAFLHSRKCMPESNLRVHKSAVIAKTERQPVWLANLSQSTCAQLASYPINHQTGGLHFPLQSA